MTKRLFLSILFVFLFCAPSQADNVQIELAKGWNLINSPIQPDDNSIAGVLSNNAGQTVSIWKWEDAKWAVYLPGEDDGGFAYAAAKGFITLTQINAGEGFWINAGEGFSLTLSGTYPEDATLTATTGWNLMGLKTGQGATVEGLFESISSKLTSAWAWIGGKWAVYLFDGTTADYAAGKDFSQLDQIEPTTGFWVNAGQNTGKFPPMVGAKVFDQTAVGKYAPVQEAEIYYKDVKIAETDFNGSFGFGVVYGFVTDSQTGAGLGGVEVSTNYGVKVTNLPTGAFLLLHPPGSFTLQGALAGYSPYESDVTVASMGFQEVNIALEAASTTKAIVPANATGALAKTVYAATADLTVTIKSQGYQDKSATLNMGSGLLDYLFIRETETIPEETFDENDLGVVKGSYDVSTFKTCPNLFVLEPPPEAIPAAPTPKVISDDQSAIIITKMKLENDITVAVETFSSTADIENPDSINAALGAAQSSQIIGGADVLISDVNGPVTSEAAGFNARVRPVTKANLSSAALKLAEMQAALANGTGRVYLFYYNEGKWQMAGEGAIEAKNGGYQTVTAEGVFFEGLYPFLFVYGGQKIVKGRIVDGSQPVPNALVSIRDSNDNVVSSLDGTFALSLPDLLTSVTLKIMHEDYYIKGQPIEFTGTETDVGDIALTPLTKKTLQGTVTTHKNAPLTNAEVVVTILNKPASIIFPDVIRTKTASDGSYIMAGIPADLLGSALVNVITADGYDPGLESSIPESATDTITLDFTLVVPLWTYQTNGNIYGSAAIDADELYIGSCDGRLYSLNAATGTEAWTYVTNSPYDPLAIFATPAVDAANVYFGTLNNQFYVLSKSDGTNAITTDPYVTVNGFPLPGENTDIISSPVLAVDALFFGSSDHNIYAFKTDGNMIWQQFKGGNITATPAVADGTLYVGSWDRYFYAHGTGVLDNTEKWKYPADAPLAGRVLSSPAVVNGMAYFGGGNNLAEDGTTVSGGDTSIYCLDAATGTEIWKYTTGGAIVSSPTVAGGIVYVGSLDHKVYALNAETGAEIWTFTTGGEVYSSPLVSNGKVYIGSNDTYLYCLDAADGSEIWKLKTRGEVISSPRASGGKIYFGSLDGAVYCVEE